jgi:hypothetical protein
MLAGIGSTTAKVRWRFRPGLGSIRLVLRFILSLKVTEIGGFISLH